MPTADWNSTASSTIATAPTTTPSGTTADCYQYYVIQSGDYCGKIEDMFGITMGQLQYWNPSLLSDCSNLDFGEAYCVNSVSEPPTDDTPVAIETGLGSGAKGRRAAAGLGVALPERTRAPEGGVPRGWPGLNAPRWQGGVRGVKNEL